MKILHSITDFIFNTPLLELSRIYTGKGKLYGKMEFIQPGGSVKDRAAFYILTQAKQKGILAPNQAVVEMSSGNMAAGLAVACLALGHPYTVVMSAGNSPERLKILKALDVNIILVPQVDGVMGKVTGNDIKKADEVARQIAIGQGAYYVDQFNNEYGTQAHYTTTGPEIWNDTEGTVTAFVATIGSAGTFTGTSTYLKEKNNTIDCIAVEPASAAILKTGKIENPQHIIQGNGYGFVPTHWEENVANAIYTLTDDEVATTTKLLSTKEALYVGYSAGANVAAAIKYLEQKNDDNARVVTILCDTAYKYTTL